MFVHCPRVLSAVDLFKVAEAQNQQRAQDTKDSSSKPPVQTIDVKMKDMQPSSSSKQQSQANNNSSSDRKDADMKTTATQDEAKLAKVPRVVMQGPRGTVSNKNVTLHSSIVLCLRMGI
jgi:hypothetical protein